MCYAKPEGGKFKWAGERVQTPNLKLMKEYSRTSRPEASLWRLFFLLGTTFGSLLSLWT